MRGALVALVVLALTACGHDTKANVTRQRGGEGRFEVVTVQVKDRSVQCIEVIYDSANDAHIALSCDWGAS